MFLWKSNQGHPPLCCLSLKDKFISESVCLTWQIGPYPLCTQYTVQSVFLVGNFRVKVSVQFSSFSYPESFIVILPVSWLLFEWFWISLRYSFFVNEFIHSFKQLFRFIEKLHRNTENYHISPSSPVYSFPYY